MTTVNTVYGNDAVLKGNEYIRFAHPNLEESHGVKVVVAGGEDLGGTGPLVVTKRRRDDGKTVYAIFAAVPLPRRIAPAGSCPAALLPIGCGCGPVNDTLILTVIDATREAGYRASLVKLYPNVAVFHTSLYIHDEHKSVFVACGQGDNCDKLYDGPSLAGAIEAAEKIAKK